MQESLYINVMAAEKMITISQKTFDRLRVRRKARESCDHLIARILDELEQSFVDRVERVTRKR